MLARGCKNYINALCFLPEIPAFGVLTSLNPDGVSFTELRIKSTLAVLLDTVFSLFEKGLLAIDIVKLRVFERMLR
jgi:hypothetical protein